MKYYVNVDIPGYYTQL